MALESGTYIDSLNAANPVATDGLNQADDHLRLIKSTIKATFPNLDGAMNATEDELNILAGATLSTQEANILDGVTATTAEINALAGMTSTSAELSILDGDTAATSTTLVDADRVVANDNGTMKQVAMSDVKTYMESNLSIDSSNIDSGAVDTAELADGAVTSAKIASSLTLGKVLQVVAGVSSGTTSHTSTSYTDSSVTVNITPSSTSNKILILANLCVQSTGNGDGAGFQVLRGSTVVRSYDNAIRSVESGVSYSDSSHSLNAVWSAHMLDSPASTSEQTYKIQVKRNTTTSPQTLTSTDGDIIVMEIAG